MATATYVKGDKVSINYTCTGAVVVDEIRVFGDSDNVSVGVSQTAGATGDVITYDIGGVYIFPAATGAVIAQGESVNWDASAGNVDDNAATPASGDVSNFGIALEAKAAAATASTVVVKLLPGVGAIT